MSRLASIFIALAALGASARAGVTPPEVTDPDGTVPMSVTASGYAAGMNYGSDPGRGGGVETQARVDVWQGLRWGAHFIYTLDVITGDSEDSTTGSRTQPYQDLDLGGSFGFQTKVPTWVFGEGHALVGNTTYGSGGALYGGIGALWENKVRTELGFGAVWLGVDRGLTVSARAEYRRLLPWLGAAVVALLTEDTPQDTMDVNPATRFAGGGELTIGPFQRWTITVDGLVGSRALAMLARGQVVENLIDVQRNTLRGFLWLDLGARSRAYLGASVRSATAPGDHDYVLTSYFAGGMFTF